MPNSVSNIPLQKINETTQNNITHMNLALDAVNDPHLINIRIAQALLTVDVNTRKKRIADIPSEISRSLRTEVSNTERFLHECAEMLALLDWELKQAGL